jgi:hypothetical protein
MACHGVGDFGRLIVGVGSFLGVFGVVGAHGINLVRAGKISKIQVR